MSIKIRCTFTDDFKQQIEKATLFCTTFIKCLSRQLIF